jgi:hypothetical protein
MAILKIDNRNLVLNQPYSYTLGNHPSGSEVLSVTDSDDFSPLGPVLVGEVGTETAEVVVPTSVATATSLNVPATKFAHPESSRVQTLAYNTVRFYWTAADTFDTDNPLGAGAMEITPDDWFTQYDDGSHATGYAWPVMYNTKSGASAISTSPIPYSNFSRRTVKRVLDSFWMGLGSNDRKHVSLEMAMEWLNEAYDKVRNAYGMIDEDYSASDGSDTIVTVPGTASYLLPDDFDEMLYVTVNGTPLASFSSRDSWQSTGWSDMRYCLRGQYVEFSPVPDEAVTVTYRYSSLPLELTAYYQVVDLPKKGFNTLKDFMFFRASTPTKRPELAAHLSLFNEEVKEIVAQSANRDNAPDSFDLAGSAWA